MKILKICMLMLLTLSFVSGSIFGENNPEGSDISKSLFLKIPAYLNVSDIDIEVSENTGTKVEPMYMSRFKGVLETTEPLYKVESRILDKLVLVKKIDSGTKIQIHGIAVSTLDGDKWKVGFKSLKIPKIHGKTISDFEVGSFVFYGSKEEENLKKQKIEHDKKKAEEREAKKAREFKETEAKKVREAEEREAKKAREFKETEAKKVREAEERKVREAREFKEAEAKKVREAEERKVREAERKKQELLVKSASGTWKGYIYCAGKDDFTLNLEPNNEKIKATYKFKTKKGMPASFILFGEIDQDYNMVFEPTGWIEKPYGYRMVGLSGKLNNKKGTFIGDATHVSVCKRFELYRLKE